MAKWTFSVSTKLKKEMDLFPEINWSNVVIEGIKRKLTILQEMETGNKPEK